MKLYLSSYRLGNRSEIFKLLAGDNKRTAVIANSRDEVPNEDRQRGVHRELADMASLGFAPEELDLRDFFQRPEDIQQTIGQYGIIWARGGNAFLLRQAMAKSGFDTALTRRLESDSDFVYGGYSAGIVVLSPSLEGLELVDDVHARPDTYDSAPVWRGLGILDYAIAPHYKSDHPESAAIDKVVDYFKSHDIEYKTLHDGEAIVIDGENEEIVGSNMS